MRASRAVLFILPVVALAIAFWLLVLAPKREEASSLEEDITALQGQVSDQEQLAELAETARKDFPQAYRRTVVLGKAAPEDDDTSSLIVQLGRIADATGVEFVSLEQETSGGAAPAAPAPSEPQTPAQAAEGSEQAVQNAEAEVPAAPAPTAAPVSAPAPIEAQAALLPIGATIGPAGLPVMRYVLHFNGTFFQLADFVAGIDTMVTTRDNGELGVNGRLVTVDSFDLAVPPVTTILDDIEDVRNPQLEADFTVTTFLTPADQGVTGGASPTGPAPVTEAAPVSTATTPDPNATAAANTP